MFFIHLCFSDLLSNRHQIFIESGGPDAYLGISNDFIDDSIFNESSLINASLSSISTPLGTNETSLNVTQLTDEPVSRVILMAVLSLVLGLMILVTVIGNFIVSIRLLIESNSFSFQFVGNVFVIAAIILERNLQNVANYLVASLAVADLLVACLVMPLGAVYEVSFVFFLLLPCSCLLTTISNDMVTTWTEYLMKCSFMYLPQISKGWILGPELCDMWTSFDVLCCTASILHLVAIATDR